MRKTLAAVILLLTPLLSFAQLSVSAIGGENGYQSLRASLYYNVNDAFYVRPFYSFYQNDDLSDGLSRYGLGVGFAPVERVLLTAEGSFVPKKNGYSDWSVGGDGRYYFFKNEKQLVSDLWAGAGASFSSYKMAEGYTDKNNSPIASYDIEETRGKIFAGANIWRLRFNTVLSKALSYSETPSADNYIWFDLPYFVTAENNFVDLVSSTGAYITTEYLDLGGGYSYYDYKAGDEFSQSISLGATVKIMGVGISGSVEFRDFDKDYKRTYFSFAANTYF